MSYEKFIVKEYSNEEIIIVWKLKLCMYFRFCFNGLFDVFDLQAWLWVNIEGVDSKWIVE